MSPILSTFGAIAARAYRAGKAIFSSFSDNFNRTTSGSLGTSSSGGLWSALKGTWFADGNAAKSNDAANTYPIANIEMSSASVTASITTGSWVTVSTTGTVGTISSNTISGATFYTATITGMSSTTGMAVGQRIAATAGTGTLFGGTPDFVEITNVVSSTSITYRTKNGTTPTAGTVTNIQTSNNDGGSGIALWITDSGNWWGVSYGRSIDNSCNCQTCSNSYCAAYTNYSSTYCAGYTNYSSTYCAAYTNYSSTYCSQYSIAYVCSAWSSTTSYTCIGWIASGYQCALYQYAGGFISFACVEYQPNESCNAWSSSTTYNCTTYGGPSYSCSGLTYTAWAPSCTGGQFTAWAPSCSGGSYTAWAASCSSTTWGYITCNCQTCYPPYIRLFKSVSSSVSEVTRWTLATMAAAFKVITTAATKVITIRAYKEVSMSTQIGADLTSTQSTATMETKFGIVLSPSDYIQGSTLDDFNITSN